MFLSVCVGRCVGVHVVCSSVFVHQGEWVSVFLCYVCVGVFSFLCVWVWALSHQ